jgi:hypothetical protein
MKRAAAILIVLAPIVGCVAPRGDFRFATLEEARTEGRVIESNPPVIILSPTEWARRYHPHYARWPVLPTQEVSRLRAEYRSYVDRTLAIADVNLYRQSFREHSDDSDPGSPDDDR